LKKNSFIIFLLFLFSYSFYFTLKDANINSRISLTRAIVEEGSFKIDRFVRSSDDFSFYKGHFYSDKAPGLSLVGSIFYFLAKDVFRIKFSEKSLRYFLTFFTVSLPSALFMVLLFNFFSSFADRVRAFIILLGYGFGTLAYPYSTLFYGHQIAAILIFSSFIFYKREKIFLSGVFSGFAILVEYSSAIFVFLFLVYLVLKKEKLGRFILGAFPFILMLLIYNRICFSSIFNLSYKYVSGSHKYVHQKGVFGFISPNIRVVKELLFGSYRGLFKMSPFLIFYFAGLYYFFKKNTFDGIFFFLIFVFYVLYNASYYFWWGGSTLGPRHLTLIIPFLVFPILFLPKYYNLLLYPFIFFSVIFHIIGVATIFQAPGIIDNPFVNFSLPLFISGFSLPNILGIKGIYSSLFIFSFILSSLWLFQKINR